MFSCAPNLLHVLISRIPGYHNLCSPDYLETNFEERKTGRIPQNRTKGKQCKTKASRRGEGVPGALPGFNKSVLRGVFTSCAETVQREFWINLDWYTPQHMPAYSHRLASKSMVMRLSFLGSKLSLMCPKFYDPASVWCKLNLIGVHNPQSHRAKTEEKEESRDKIFYWHGQKTMDSETLLWHYLTKMWFVF